MKHSALIRFLVVMALLACWVWSIFPVKDKDFLQTLSTLAAPRLAALERQATPESKAAVERFRMMELSAQKIIDAAAVGADGGARRTLAPYIAVENAIKAETGAARLRLGDYISVPLQDKPSNKFVLNYVRRNASGKIRLGLDIRGGTEFIIGFDENTIQAEDNGRKPSVESVREEVLKNLERRVNALGVAEPEIKPIGRTSISVRMPSVTENDKEAIRDLLKQAGRLEFHIVHPQSEMYVQQYTAAPRSFIPPTGYYIVETEPEDGAEQGSFLLIKKWAEPVRGSDVKKAWASPGQFGGFEVELSFNGTGAKAFGEVTAANVEKRMGIMLDGRVYSAPVIKGAITGGTCQITGNFSAEESQNLASILNGGRMPVQTRIDGEFGTDPTLGADSIKAGMMAGLWGAALVILFMLIYYHLSGAVAVFAMVANILFQVGTMAILGSTFTMPGIAGIVLTIGMAVDANILIYERFREEQASGKTFASVVDAGFSRAFWTIFDSHITALFAGIILYYFGTGPVKGFAVALSIGLVANLFTSIILSRSIYDLMIRYCAPKKLTMLHIFRSVPHINFMGMRRVFFTFSIILTVAALVLIGWRFSRGEALSTDFIGGTTMTYQYDSHSTRPEVDAIRKEAAAQKFARDLRIGYKDAGVTQQKLLEVTIPESQATVLAAKNKISSEAAMETLKAGVTAMLKDKFPFAKFEQKETYHVGGSVGEQFKTYAILSLLFSCAGIILYLAFRFEFAYGVAAVIALVHDVIVAAGIGALFDKQLSLTVLAALLTIIGYSVNDTIVVFDRIRESFSLQRKGSYEDVVNLSINQTLSRTLLTSLTVFFCVLALYLIGGGAINDFALIMLAGVVVGTYSSVFIASAIVVSWHKRRPLNAAAPVKKVEEDVLEEEA